MTSRRFREFPIQPSRLDRFKRSSFGGESASLVEALSRFGTATERRGYSVVAISEHSYTACRIRAWRRVRGVCVRNQKTISPEPMIRVGGKLLLGFSAPRAEPQS